MSLNCSRIKLIGLLSIFSVLFALFLSCFAFASETNADWLTIDAQTPTGALKHHDQTPIANTYWNAETRQLDLTGATIDDYDELSINLTDQSVTINVTNYNKIYGKGGIGIYFKGNLLLQGSGTLDVEGADCQGNSEQSYGIRMSSGTFTAKDLCLNLTSAKSDKSSYGLYAKGTMEAVTFDNAKVNVLVNGDKAINQGIVANTNINIDNNSSVYVVVNDALSGHSTENNVAIYQSTSDEDCGVFINNSYVDVKSGNGTGGEGNNSYGIYARSGLVCNNSAINADSGFVCDIADNKKTSCGIYAGNKCIIENGSIIDTFACDGFNSFGMQADSDIFVDNSILNTKSSSAKQYSNGIYCNKKAFSASNGSQISAVSGDIDGDALERTSTTGLYVTKGITISGAGTIVKAASGYNYVVGSDNYDTSIGISSHGYVDDESFSVLDGAEVYANAGSSNNTSYGIYATCYAHIGDAASTPVKVCAIAGDSDESYGIYSRGIDVNNAMFYAFGNDGVDYSSGIWSDGGSVTFGDNINCQFGSFEALSSCQHAAVAAIDQDSEITSEIIFDGGIDTFFIDNCNETSITNLMTSVTDEKVVSVQKPEIGVTSVILDEELHSQPACSEFAIPVFAHNFMFIPNSMDVVVSSNDDSNYYKEFNDVPYINNQLVINIADAPEGDYNLEVITSQCDYIYSSSADLIISSYQPDPVDPSYNPTDNTKTSDSLPIGLIILIVSLLALSSVYVLKKN